jgi:hypothetical protein
LYVAPSANIASGGEATTQRLTGGTGTFLTGRRWDDENGADALDLGANQNTEVEWALKTQSPAVNGDYWDFRVYAGSNQLDSYAQQPRLTLSASVVYRRALIVSSGRVRQILDAELGTGLKPVVLMSDGTVRVRETTEGVPVVLDDNMRMKTLGPGEQLLI